MTKQEKILKRALEMAVSKAILMGACLRRQTTIMCGDYSECDSKSCRASHVRYFLKQAKESICHK